MSRIRIDAGTEASWGSAACLPGEILQAQNDNLDHARKSLQAREQALRAVDKTIRAADAVIRAAKDVILTVDQEAPDPRQRDLFADIVATPVLPPLRPRRRSRAGWPVLTGSLASALTLLLVPDLPPAWTGQAGSAIAAATSFVTRFVEPRQEPSHQATIAPAEDRPVAKLEPMPIREPVEPPRSIAVGAGEPTQLASTAVAPAAIDTAAPQSEPPAPPSQPSPPTVEAAPVTETIAPACAERADTAVLVKRGEDFIAAGDIASARLLFRRAALACDARAALALAATFDPNMLKRLGVRGIAPDQERARDWYLKASALGSPEATHRLAGLGTPAE